MEITKIFDSLEEIRSKTNQKYPVQEIAFLVVVSLMCGMNSWHAMCRFGNTNLDWLRMYFPYSSGIPTRHNIARIIRAIKPESLSELLVDWAKNYHSFEAVQSAKKSIATKNKDDKKKADGTTNFQNIIAIDGKDVRGVQARTDSALNVVSVFDVGNGITIGAEMGLGKGQKIEMVRKVLSKLNLKQCIVTLDALHCQKETVEEIVKQNLIISALATYQHLKL